MSTTLHHRGSRLAFAALALLALFPPVAGALGQEFYVSFATRVMIFALAATSLGLILGFGGMVSFGHAAFFGLGAYTVAMLMERGIASAWIAWPAAAAVAAIFALAIGAIALYGLRRVANSRFGRALQAIRENEPRMEAIGYPVLRLKLAAFTLAGAVAGLAGALIANQNGLVSPGLLGWQQSGLLMVMVILGGTRSLYGGVLGATAMLVLEEVLSQYTLHWQLGLGAVLLAVVLFTPQGIAGIARRLRG